MGLLSPEDLGRGKWMKGGWVSMRKHRPPPTELTGKLRLGQSHVHRGRDKVGDQAPGRVNSD